MLSVARPGYNVLYYDGHACTVADPNRDLPATTRGQGINGLNSTQGLLTFETVFSTVE